MANEKISEMELMVTHQNTDIFPVVQTTNKRTTFTLIKAFLKTYFDTLYPAKNAAITGATKTKITYDAKGLVTAGADATTQDIAQSGDNLYVSAAEKIVWNGKQDAITPAAGWNGNNGSINRSGFNSDIYSDPDVKNLAGFVQGLITDLKAKGILTD